MNDNSNSKEHIPLFEKTGINSNHQSIEPPSNEGEVPVPQKKRALVWLTLFLIFTGICWAAAWFFYFRYHESTNDAYANGCMINVNASVSGSVIAFYADNTDLVLEGQLLALLDPTEYQILYEKELTKLAAIVLQVRQIYQQVNVSEANVEAKKVALAKAQFDHDNRLELHNHHPLAVSNEDFVHSKDDLEAARVDLKLAEYQLKAATDAAGETTMINHPLLEEQKNAVKKAFYELSHCSIYAPYTGYIAQRAVNVGQSITPLTDLMAIIPTNNVWVDANFKETQLTHMRVGQPATIWFDLYGPDVMFEGKVLGIPSGSGSVFSLIPPQNATGNWIKIVQRLPVRISLNSEQVAKYPIRLGISAEVNVNISNRDLPMLVQSVSEKPIATTKVFDIDFSPANRAIEEIIQMNLKDSGLQESQ